MDVKKFALKTSLLIRMVCVKSLMFTTLKIKNVKLILSLLKGFVFLSVQRDGETKVNIVRSLKINS